MAADATSVKRGSGGPRASCALLAASAVTCAFLAVVLVARPFSDDAVMTINSVVEIVVPLATAVPCCLAAAARSTGRRRASWALLAAGAFAWAAGQAAWTWFEVVSGTEPFPSVADIGFLGAVPLLVLGVAWHPASLLRMGRVRIVVDGAIVATALLFVASGTFLGAIRDSGSGTAVEQALLLAYPVADVLAVAVAVALAGRRPHGLRGPLGLLLAGVCSLAVADSSFAWLQAQGSGGDHVTDLFWPLGFLFIAAAAARSTGDDADVDVESQVRSATPHEAWLPQVPVALAGVVLAYRGLSGDGVGPFLATTAAVLIVLVVTRQAFVQLENAELSRNLERIVHQLRSREDQLQHQAFHDPLTELANRALFRDRLEHATSRRHRDDVTVLFVDLDDFKTVNDTMGHDVGDQLLVLLAERLRACVRSGDTVARLGGDEFAVLLDDGGSTDGAELGARILDALEVPFAVGGREVRARASVGVVSMPQGDATADGLLRDADLAMYAAKAFGGSRVESFEPAMRSEAIDRLELLGDLEGVLDRAELELHFQPIVRLPSGDVAGHEALLRWNHGRRGTLAPAAFLDLAEETGLIVPIGWWVLEETCRVLAARGGDAWASVNLSVHQLHDSTLTRRIRDLLVRHGIDASRLVVEVSERALAEGAELVDRLRELRGLGVRVAIDDFGTGYSSLAALARLPLDAVKIDGRFIAGLGARDGEVLVRAIVDLANALGLRTVAEGVEQPWQLERVVALGCDAAQGYLLGRPSPVPAGAATADLKSVAGA